MATRYRIPKIPEKAQVAVGRGFARWRGVRLQNGACGFAHGLKCIVVQRVSREQPLFLSLVEGFDKQLTVEYYIARCGIHCPWKDVGCGFPSHSLNVSLTRPGERGSCHEFCLPLGAATAGCMITFGKMRRAVFAGASACPGTSRLDCASFAKTFLTSPFWSIPAKLSIRNVSGAVGMS